VQLLNFVVKVVKIACAVSTNAWAANIEWFPYINTCETHKVPYVY